MFQIDDKVKVVSSGKYVDTVKPGDFGVVVKVDPDDDLLPYYIHFENINDKLWCTVDPERTDHVVIALYTQEINTIYNDYKSACWHCREGGIVDRLAFATGLILSCPVCGRVCDGRKVD